MNFLQYIIVFLLYRYSFSIDLSSGFTEIIMRCRAKCGSDKCNALCYNLHRLHSKTNCSSFCKNDNGIIESCLELCSLGEQFISKGIKQGSCPTNLDGFALARINQCKKDLDCPSSLKCCNNKQWRTCQQAVFHMESRLPPVPSSVHVRVETSSVVNLAWRSPSFTSSVFLIELRYSSKILRPSEDEMTSWQSAGQTPSLSHKVKGLTPGAWYQFRVSSWSENGTNGFNYSEFVQLPGLVRRPSQPRNVSASGAWIRDGKVDVELSWQRPLILDAPVRRYRIIWYKHVLGSTEHYAPVPVHRIRVRGRKQSALLKGLDLNSVYMVQIQALTRGAGQPRIRGRWKSVLIKTPLVGGSQEPTGRTSSKRKPTNPPTTKSNYRSEKKEKRKLFPGPNVKYIDEQSVKALNVTVSHIVLSVDGYPEAVLNCDANDNVNAIRLSWSPDNCSDLMHATARSKLVPMPRKKISLTELRPDCVYSVKVIPFLPGGRRGRMEIVKFSTDVNKMMSSALGRKTTKRPRIKLKATGRSAATQTAKSQSFCILFFLLPILWLYLFVLDFRLNLL